MSARANELANQFEAANAEVLAFVSACDDATWNTSCEGEGWPICAVAAHIADGYKGVTGWIREIVAGRPVTVTPDQLNASNAARAATNAGRSRDAVLVALRERAAAAADLVRSLSDEELARSVPFGLARGETVTAAWLAENALVGHPRRHLASMRASAGTT